jgi:hypothetical protein
MNLSIIDHIQHKLGKPKIWEAKKTCVGLYESRSSAKVRNMRSLSMIGLAKQKEVINMHECKEMQGTRTTSNRDDMFDGSIDGLPNDSRCMPKLWENAVTKAYALYRKQWFIDPTADCTWKVCVY